MALVPALWPCRQRFSASGCLRLVISLPAARDCEFAIPSHFDFHTASLADQMQEAVALSVCTPWMPVFNDAAINADLKENRLLPAKPGLMMSDAFTRQCMLGSFDRHVAPCNMLMCGHAARASAKLFAETGTFFPSDAEANAAAIESRRLSATWLAELSEMSDYSESMSGFGSVHQWCEDLLRQEFPDFAEHTSGIHKLATKYLAKGTKWNDDPQGLVVARMRNPAPQMNTYTDHTLLGCLHRYDNYRLWLLDAEGKILYVLPLHLAREPLRRDESPLFLYYDHGVCRRSYARDMSTTGHDDELHYDWLTMKPDHELYRMEDTGQDVSLLWRIRRTGKACQPPDLLHLDIDMLLCDVLTTVCGAPHTHTPAMIEAIHLSWAHLCTQEAAAVTTELTSARLATLQKAQLVLDASAEERAVWAADAVQQSRTREALPAALCDSDAGVRVGAHVLARRPGTVHLQVGTVQACHEDGFHTVHWLHNPQQQTPRELSRDLVVLDTAAPPIGQVFVSGLLRGPEQFRDAIVEPEESPASANSGDAPAPHQRVPGLPGGVHGEEEVLVAGHVAASGAGDDGDLAASPGTVTDKRGTGDAQPVRIPPPGVACICTCICTHEHLNHTPAPAASRFVPCICTFICTGSMSTMHLYLLHGPLYRASVPASVTICTPHPRTCTHLLCT